jgi:hypothetical protein
MWIWFWVLFIHVVSFLLFVLLNALVGDRVVGDLFYKFFSSSSSFVSSTAFVLPSFQAVGAVSCLSFRLSRTVAVSTRVPPPTPPSCCASRPEISSKRPCTVQCQSSTLLPRLLVGPYGVELHIVAGKPKVLSFGPLRNSSSITLLHAPSLQRTYFVARGLIEFRIKLCVLRVLLHHEATPKFLSFAVHCPIGGVE